MRSYYLVSLLLCLLLGLFGCRVIPIQMTHVALNERFTQTFFDKTGIAEREIIQAVRLLLGEKNYTNLYTLSVDRLDQLKNNECESRGFANLGLTLVPNRTFSKSNFDFFVSGNGYYSIILTADNLIYYTATFQVDESETYSVSDLEKGVINVKFRQQLISHFVPRQAEKTNREELYKNYTNESEVIAHLHLKKTQESVYSIDYEASHAIYISNYFVGNLRFVPPRHPKLIDLRGLRFVRNTY